LELGIGDWGFGGKTPKPKNPNQKPKPPNNLI